MDQVLIDIRASGVRSTMSIADTLPFSSSPAMRLIHRTDDSKELRTSGRCGTKVIFAIVLFVLVSRLLVDVPDQPSIVRQYMRYTAQIQSGKNARQMVLRALQMFVDSKRDTTSTSMALFSTRQKSRKSRADESSPKVSKKKSFHSPSA